MWYDYLTSTDIIKVIWKAFTYCIVPDTAQIKDNKFQVKYTYRGKDYSLVLPYDENLKYPHLSIRVYLDGEDITHQPGIPYRLASADFGPHACLELEDEMEDERVVINDRMEI